MRPRRGAAEDALFDRADRAIADAIATRDEVQARLIAAGRAPIHRAEPHGRPASPRSVEPFPTLEPWWSVARALSSAVGTLRVADDDLERSWRRVLSAVGTPVSLLRA